MCGIFCAFSHIHDKLDIKLIDVYESCKPYIASRGPNFISCKRFSSHGTEIFCSASVLWLQGNCLVQQPIETDNSIFMYNGDVFGGTLLSDELRAEHGDTLTLLKCLESVDNIFSVLLMIQGPYAIIYLDKRTMKVYFLRDVYGRRSLIVGVNLQALVLTSVIPKNSDFKCIELPALGIFCFDLKSNIVSLYPWSFKHSNFNLKFAELESILDRKIVVQEPEVSLNCKQFLTPSKLELRCYKGFVGDYHVIFQTLLQNKEWSNRVNRLCALLEAAVRKRIGTQPPFCQNCIDTKCSCSHTTTGILFSGGIDCAILALIAHKFVDENRPIDLLNVAFNNSAPDRATGLETLKELQTLCPTRSWNFVEIDVSNEELQIHRDNHIKHLIFPLNSILDDSLGCALWFAGRGMSRTYRSPCRVLLVGMGADELFGGYTKHRAALKRGGWIELNKMLEDDWQNISHRNLARDDRVVSDHGRQLRTPYLDENVVDFVRGLNCWERTCPSENLPQGVGEKILLRSLGYYLGLINAAGLKKRALQFGSRIANSKENANDVSPRL